MRCVWNEFVEGEVWLCRRLVVLFMEAPAGGGHEIYCAVGRDRVLRAEQGLEGEN
jgi:hypothetical protein